MSFTSLVHCRLCAKLKHIIDIVDLTSNMETRTEIIDKLAIFCADTVDFTDQTLPETVCINCRDSVRNSYDFFKKIKESQLELKNSKYSSYQKLSNSKEVTEESNPIVSNTDDEKSHFEEFSDIKSDLENEEDSYCFEDISMSNCEANVQTPNAEQINSSPKEPELETRESDDESFECTACGESFPTWKELQQHTSTDNDHIPKKRTKATIEELTCDVCFKVFSIPSRLRFHKLKYTKRSRNFICEVCGKGFYIAGALKNHMTIHNPEYHNCKICNKTFNNLLRLKDHLKTHSAKKFECNECHRMFGKKSYISSHMAVHSDKTQYSCKICKKSFRFKQLLNNHSLIHTGERPFVCKFCNKDFTNWPNCNKHMLRIHGATMAKTVRTAHGTVPLDQKTMKPVEVDDESLKWIEQMCKPIERTSKKKKMSKKKLADNDKNVVEGQ